MCNPVVLLPNINLQDLASSLMAMGEKKVNGGRNSIVQTFSSCSLLILLHLCFLLVGFCSERTSLEWFRLIACKLPAVFWRYFSSPSWFASTHSSVSPKLFIVTVLLDCCRRLASLIMALMIWRFPYGTWDVFSITVTVVVGNARLRHIPIMVQWKLCVCVL